jgi:hypothetical protein
MYVGSLRGLLTDEDVFEATSWKRPGQASVII